MSGKEKYKLIRLMRMQIEDACHGLLLPLNEYEKSVEFIKDCVKENVNNKGTQ